MSKYKTTLKSRLEEALGLHGLTLPDAVLQSLDRDDEESHHEA